MNSNYSSQDRGDNQHYQQYLSAMDAISIEKVASASSFFPPLKGNTLVDVGMASGTSSAILANLFPHLNIIGVDINPTMVDIARANYQQTNLSFRIDDGEKLTTFSDNSVDGFFNCSSIHHITSYNGYDSNRAINTFKRQTQLLKDRGVLVVRDFVKVPERIVILELSMKDHVDRPNDCQLLIQFSQTARSLAAKEQRGFPLKSLPQLRTGWQRFQLFYADAVEFIRRKDYFADWDVELQEEYGYLTQSEFEHCFRDLGLRIIVSSPIYNQWIIRNRYQDQFYLYDLSGQLMGPPPTNYLIAGEKVSQGGRFIGLTRHLPAQEPAFLHYSSYLNKQTDRIYDVAERPNEVIDILPYYQTNTSVTILARHGYPRPLANIQSISPLLDGKHFSGYITEGLAIAVKDNDDDIIQIVNKRFHIPAACCQSVKPALNYYTSPGGINERVISKLIPLTEIPEQSVVLEAGYSGFKESGYLHQYDATQLLNTAQTGALAEARLELNIYHLFSQLNRALPDWLGERITFHEQVIDKTASLSSLLAMKQQQFVPSTTSAGFLRTERVLFTESGDQDSQAVLEYVYPEYLSTNTLVTMPVCKMANEIYVGLEHRNLPVPQNFSGNSTLLTLPARRLDNKIKTLYELQQWIANLAIADSQIDSFTKLGEKYFPSLGITPEQVYPYVVTLIKPSTALSWVKLDELWQNRQNLQDAHLLICLARLRHALT